jgi:hypothetical protein
LTIKAAVAFIGISRSELYRRMDAGLLPRIKDGTRRKIPKRALVQDLESKLHSAA